MRKYKCPDCGKEFNDGNIPVECPICGCPADIIKKNEICPQCGKPLLLQNMNFCTECGCNLSAQPIKDYDVICPDCNSVIADENLDCPICSCPSNMFIKRAKTKFVSGAKLECPYRGQSVRLVQDVNKEE